jgi:hypothetical protein
MEQTAFPQEQFASICCLWPLGLGLGLGLQAADCASSGFKSLVPR